MPTTSYPYNVVITRDPLVLNKIFFDKLGRTSFSDAFSRLNASEKEKALIVSPRSNNNFISLDVNFPAKASGKGAKYVVLKLLETSKLLEYFNIATNAFENLLISRAKVKKAVLGDNEIIDELAKGLSPRFYFSFGVGDNTNEWSGPYNLDLIDANISITSDGVRQLELMFTPTTDSMLVFTNKLFNDFQYGQEDSVFDTAANKDVIIRTTRAYELQSELKATSTDDGWNYCVRDIVSNFISDRFPTVPLGNVVCLIPDDFEDLLKVANPRGGVIDANYKEVLKKLGIDISLDHTPLTKVRRIKSINDQQKKVEQKQESLNASIKEGAEKIINEKSTKLKNLRKQLAKVNAALVGPVNADPQLSPLTVAGGIKASTLKLKERHKSLKREIEAIEVEIVSQKEGNLTVQDAAGFGTLRIMAVQNLADRAIARASIKSNPDYNALNTFDAGLLTHFRLSMGGIVDTGTKELDNTLKTLAPLYTFIKGVYDVSSPLHIEDFTILEENDSKILKLLKKHGIIEKEESPVVIFGRLSTITRLIYPDAVRPLETGKAIDGLISLDRTRARLADRDPAMSKRSSESVRRYRNRIAIAYAEREAAPFGIWKGYAKDFVKLFKPRAGFRTSSFGEGLGENASPIGELIAQSGSDSPLVFTHNVKNSNVLNLSFDSSPYKGELLSYSTESLYRVMDGVFTGEQLIQNSSFTKGPLAILIEAAATDIAFERLDNTEIDVLAILKKTLSTGAAKKQLKLLSKSEDAVTARTFFDAVLLKATSYSNGVKQEVPMGGVGTSEAEILRRMNKAVINVNIKTLPFFNIPLLPGKKCVLFGKPNLVKGATELRGKLESEPAFYTNAYTITGYKHRITSTDAYSEFSLIQDSFAQGATLGNTTMEAFFEQEIKAALEAIPDTGTFDSLKNLRANAK